MVLVGKKNGKWLMCVDFTDLNRACPKDGYPFPKKIGLVNEAVGCEAFSFLDACARYNQIPLHGPDQEKTAFVTETGLYCFTVMPFGLKNSATTFQTMGNGVFKDHIGKTIEIYIDDILIKSKKKEYNPRDL